MLEHLLSILGTQAVGQLIKKLMEEGANWIKTRGQKPSVREAEKKLREIASANLPDSVPANQRRSVSDEMSKLVIPTFEQTYLYDPKLQHLMEKAGKEGGGGFPKRHPGKKVVAAAKKTAWKNISPARKTALKRTVAKKVAAKKMAARKSTM